MEILLNVIISAAMITFSICNVCLYKMKRRSFVALFGILFAALLPGAFIGQFSSFLIIIAILIYGLAVNKCTRPQNISVGYTGYLITVVINNLFSGIYSLFSHRFLPEDSYFWVIYVPVMFFVTYLISFFCGKLIRNRI